MMIPMMKKRIVIMMTLWRLPITPSDPRRDTQARRRAIERATRKIRAREKRRARRFGKI